MHTEKKTLDITIFKDYLGLMLFILFAIIKNNAYEFNKVI